MSIINAMILNVKGQISIKVNIRHKNSEQFIKENDIKEIHKHDIEMEEHNYIRNIQIKEDLNILGKQ